MLVAFFVLPWSLLALLRRLLVAHLAIINEGSPTPEAPYRIDDVTLAQALYARLEASSSHYYQFVLATDTELRLSMLVPQQHYQGGFRPRVVLSGPTLPGGQWELHAEDHGMRIGTTAYQRTQRISPTLAAGTYQIMVASDRAGVYCLCVGTREPEQYADDATRARVKKLVEGL